MASGSKIVVGIGGIPNPIFPQRVSQTVKFLANALAITTATKTLKYNVQVPPTGSRFYGDPGVGNRYIGMEAKGGNISNFQHFEGLVNFTTSLRRFYNSTGDLTNIGANFNRCVADGKIPVQDLIPFGSASGVNPGDFVANTAGAQTYKTTMKNLINGASPMPVILGDTHEPWNGPKVSPTQGALYRADIRNLITYLKANCPNLIYHSPCYERFDFTNGSASRDWRVFHADWKGTSTNFGDGSASAWNKPNPVDFFSPSIYDAFGIDLYTYWGNYFNGVHKTTWTANWLTLQAGYNLVYNIIKGVPTLAAQPWVVGEYGTNAFCGDPDHGWTNASTVGHSQDLGSFSTANKNQTQTNLQSFHDNPNIFAFCYWNSGGDTEDWDAFTGGTPSLDTDPFNWKTDSFNTAGNDPRTVPPVKQ